MSAYVVQFFITIAAIIAAQYIQTAIFVLFKADRYEDNLSIKIAKAVKKELS